MQNKTKTNKKSLLSINNTKKNFFLLLLTCMIFFKHYTISIKKKKKKKKPLQHQSYLTKTCLEKKNNQLPNTIFFLFFCFLCIILYEYRISKSLSLEFSSKVFVYFDGKRRDLVFVFLTFFYKKCLFLNTSKEK